MGQSQWYIGAENGVVVCVDRVEQGNLQGRMFHSYNSHAVCFSSIDQLIYSMYSLFEYLEFPRNATKLRFFAEDESGRPSSGYHEVKERKKIMQDKELLEQHGNVETFIVRVQHRQNSTWQGRITWAKENKTINFRSIWEMIHLMENAMYKDSDPDAMPKIRVWEDSDTEG